MRPDRLEQGARGSCPVGSGLGGLRMASWSLPSAGRRRRHGECSGLRGPTPSARQEGAGQCHPEAPGARTGAGGGGTSSRGRCLWPHPDLRNHISQAAPGGAGELPGLPTLDPTWEAARWWLCPGSSVCKPRTAGPRRSQACRYLTSDFRLQNSRKQSNSLPVFKPPGLWCLVPQGGLRGVQAWEEVLVPVQPSACTWHQIRTPPMGQTQRGHRGALSRLSLLCLCSAFVYLVFCGCKGITTL